ncbi:MAG TPA: hypothetical protein PLN48_03390 [Lachnospiraceae bacterium]|nr:hypothetical protein [Lachnospiraceae bacterium]
MFWYEEAIENLSDKEYSRRELLEYLQELHPSLTANTFCWILAKMSRDGKLHKVGRNSYVRKAADSRKTFRPNYSMQALRVRNSIMKQYEWMDFCLFETNLLEKSAAAALKCSAIFVQVRKESSRTIFELLRRDFKNVFYKPSRKEIESYKTDDMIIVVDKISEAPRNKKRPYDIVLEKLLVDLIAEKNIGIFVPEESYLMSLKTAYEKSPIDELKMMRYARRRGASVRLKELLEEARLESQKMEENTNGSS